VFWFSLTLQLVLLTGTTAIAATSAHVFIQTGRSSLTFGTDPKSFRGFHSLQSMATFTATLGCVFIRFAACTAMVGGYFNFVDFGHFRQQHIFFFQMF
jgi:hypothetical protein|tara:strand:- start:146 stop:439 length:294 start_codon:yes stop_codon:yes gene_type:complete